MVVRDDGDGSRMKLNVGGRTTVAGTVESSSAMMVRPPTLMSNVRLWDSFWRLAFGDGGGDSAGGGSGR